MKYILFRLFRKLYRLITRYNPSKEKYGICYDSVEFFGDNAQLYIKNRLEEAYAQSSGLMLAKFGTYELYSLMLYLREYKHYPTLKGFNILKTSLPFIKLKDCIYNMNMNAGVFPATLDAIKNTAERYYKDIPEVDLLVSYQSDERFVKDDMPNCKYVDFYSISPFMYDNPWTEFLRDKKVLIVHPFVESVRVQYENNREHLFDNPKVLPRFKSISYIKAVQSAVGEQPKGIGINCWSDALEMMEKQIDAIDYDIAIIGCGAYGLPLAAYVKRKGKIGLHMASMTQMLFGVYGTRWIEDQPEYTRYINEYWIRPQATETPTNSRAIENGCYW